MYDKFNMIVSWKHTQKVYKGIDFEDVNKLIQIFMKDFEDLPDPKIKIEIFREYE